MTLFTDRNRQEIANTDGGQMLVEKTCGGHEVDSLAGKKKAPREKWRWKYESCKKK